MGRFARILSSLRGTMPDDILELSVLTAPRPPRFRGQRYRIGPLATRADRSILTVGASIRKGAFAGLSVAAVLAVPFFLVLGARAPAPQAFATAPVVESAKVWTESDATVPAATPRIAEVRPTDPVAASAGADDAARRSALSVASIPVLDDDSGDLSIGEIVPAAEAAAPIRPVRPLPATPPRASSAARP